MIQNTSRFFGTSFCFVLLIITGLQNLYGQKATPETIFSYLKNSDNTRTLTYTVKYKKDDDEIPAKGIFVDFKEGYQNQPAKVKTDETGTAKFIMPASANLMYEPNGKLKFSATIEKNDLVEIKSDELSLTDIEIHLEFKIVDSVKKIFFKAFELGPNGEKKPIPKTDINFYVPRMFSLLKVAEGSFGDDGTGEVEIPSGLPGDSLGNVKIVGRIEDNADFLNVAKGQTVAWGTPTNYHIPKFKRALWTAVAPTWMIITLTILLFGVWAHYSFVFYKLWKIKQESRLDL